MNNYLFEINHGPYEGERFFIQANSWQEAIENFIFSSRSLTFLGEYTDEEVKEMGYDIY